MYMVCNCVRERECVCVCVCVRLLCDRVLQEREHVHVGQRLASATWVLRWPTWRSLSTILPRRCSLTVHVLQLDGCAVRLCLCVPVCISACVHVSCLCVCVCMLLVLVLGDLVPGDLA